MAFFKHKFFFWFLAIASLGWCMIEASGSGDFFIFMQAAGDLPRGLMVYDVIYGDGFHYYYSVLFAIVLRPFYTLPFYGVKVVWLALNLFLYIKMFLLLVSATPVKQLPEKRKNIFLLLVFVFSLRFLHDNIHTSQITILILACCVFGLHYIHRGKAITGAAILALGINIKLLPIVLLPYLVYRGYFKAFGFTILFYATGLLLPSLLIGHDYNMALLDSWWNLINPMNKQHVLDTDERSFHSLSTLLSTLLVKNVPDIYALPLKRNIADVSLETLSRVLLLVRGVLVLFTLWFLKGNLFKPAKTETAGFFELSYILLLIPLIFPHQQHYAFLFSVPAFALILYVLMRDKELLKRTTRLTVSILLALIYLCANLKILLGEFNGYYEHYKILTYGALLLIPLLIWGAKQVKSQNVLS